ncbi:MAG: right-handed parallel beta-helix repeat-containing protein [Opitutaceae bacterium]|nr:right-handed parallel beta-helix repeat-containing protein [Opitutaceae bacterium]
MVALPNADFEGDEVRWDFSAARGTAQVSPEAAFSGAKGLRIDSRDDDTGAFIASARLPVDTTHSYRLFWQGRVISGAGTNIYLCFFDAKGVELLREEGRIGTDKGNRWTPGQLNAIPPLKAASMEVIVQRPAWRTPGYLIDVDDFELRAAPIIVKAPWTGTYKLRPEDKDRLTDADVVGPDGRVYPDWTWAGVPGGIPTLPVAVNLADAGARPGQDVSTRIEQAAATLSAAGGGAIVLGQGTYYLDQPVMIYGSNVVIRGAGQNKTRLLFRYHIPFGELRFFRVKPGDTLGQNAGIEFHANPKNLIGLELRCGDKTIERRTRQDHWGDTFSLRVGVKQALDLLGEGPHVFTAIAEYDGGKRVTRDIGLHLSRDLTGELAPQQLGAINFIGRGAVSDKRLLAESGARGSRRLKFAKSHGFAVGEKITLVAPVTEHWKKQVGHNSHWHIQAQNMFEITAVEDDTVTLRQPLRVEFPVEDGSYAQKIEVISRSGVEDLTLEQQVVPNQGPRGPIISQTIWHAIEDLWTSGVIYNQAWGCWMKNVTVRNTGRNSVYFPLSKHIEVRDCLLDDAIFKGGGGTGYVGFDRSFDCLMDNIEVKGMRHAPNSQWNSAGNVVRNSRFDGSDGQWHAGWTLENLYENNFIDARGKGGSYGHGLYASGPSSGIHGPQGPRNVAYNNDIVARKDCLHMLGGNEAWMILHNRFVTDNGRAIFAKEKSFDHVIDGNVFVLRKPVSQPVLLGLDSVGVELTNNTFYGVNPPLVSFTGERTTLLRDEGNILHADVPETMPDRPRPAVASLFQWQRDQAAAVADEKPPAEPSSPPASLP